MEVLEGQRKERIRKRVRGRERRRKKGRRVKESRKNWMVFDKTIPPLLDPSFLLPLLPEIAAPSLPLFIHVKRKKERVENLC